MKTNHRTVADLVQEYMLETRATDLTVTPRIQLEPDGFEQLMVRFGISRDYALLLQEQHGGTHDIRRQQGIHEVVLFLLFHCRYMLVDHRINFIVVEQGTHFFDRWVREHLLFIDGKQPRNNNVIRLSHFLV